MAPTKKKAAKKPGRLVVRLVLMVFAVYAALTLMEGQVRLAERRLELEALEAHHEVRRLEHKELERQLAQDLTREDVGRIAREHLDFVEPDQKVFIDISGR
jgi:cell division protein FtsB